MATQKPPKYCLHKASGKAYVWLHGRRVYLGPYGSPESRERYARALAEAAEPSPLSSTLLVRDLVEAHAAWSKSYYGPDQVRRIALATRELNSLFGSEPAAEFGPRRLRVLMQQWVDDGHARTTINSWKGCVVRIWKWGVSRELVPEPVYRALCSVDNLQKGRTAAKEPDGVTPVSRAQVDAVKPHVNRIVWAMIEGQWYSGMRPGEVCIMRPMDVQRSGDVWRYVPHRHKGSHINKSRVVFLGPKAQEAIGPFLERPAGEFCFNPKEALEERLDAAEGHRRERQAPTPRKTRRKQYTLEHYTPAVYANAVARACAKAGIDRWSPNRLRHACATQVCDMFGIEGASRVLGHSKIDTTSIYTTQAEQLAMAIALRIG